jgi:phage-related protein
VVQREKPVVWLHGEVRTPPFSLTARQAAGVLLRRLQRGETLSLPHSRPLPVVGSRCHELRVADGPVSWRVVYHVAADAVVILEVFRKSSRRTPKPVVDQCQRRLRRYQSAAGTTEE